MKKLIDLCDNSGTKIKFSSLYHPMFLGFIAVNLQYCGYDHIGRSPSLICGWFFMFSGNHIEILKENGYETTHLTSFVQN